MKRALGASALVLAALLLAGCSAGMSTGDSASAPHNGVPLVQQDAGAADGGKYVPLEAVPGAATDRAVITTGNVSITATEPIAAASDASKLVTGAGGRVDSRTEQPATETQPASASLVIRVPADQLDEVLDNIKLLGTVNSVSINASDVTQQKQDIDARITALQTSVDRLLELMSSSANTTDLIAIESALSERQAELDSLTAQRDSLDDQIDFSTVYLDFVSEGTVAESGPSDFWGGLAAGWNALIAFLGGLVVVIGVILPWLLPLGVLAAIVVAIVGAVRRRRARTDSGDAASGDASNRGAGTTNGNSKGMVPPPPPVDNGAQR